jgi:hypothetical protein
MAVTMNSVVFWDIKTQIVPHRRHITSPLQRQAGQCYVRFEVFTAVTMKNAVFWDVNAVWLLLELMFRKNVSPQFTRRNCLCFFTVCFSC